MHRGTELKPGVSGGSRVWEGSEQPQRLSGTGGETPAGNTLSPWVQLWKERVQDAPGAPLLSPLTHKVPPAGAEPGPAEQLRPESSGGGRVHQAEHTNLLSWIYTLSFTEQFRFLLCWFQPFLTLMQSSTVKKTNPNKPQSNHKALSCLLTLLLSFPGYSTSARSPCPYKMITKFSSSPRKLQLGQDKHWGRHPEHALPSPWSCPTADITLDECLKEFERSTCFKSK